MTRALRTLALVLLAAGAAAFASAYAALAFGHRQDARRLAQVHDALHRAQRAERALVTAQWRPERVRCR